MASERERVCQDDDVFCENDSASTTIESPMETESEVESEMKPSSSLQLMLSSIADERNKGGFIGPRILSDRDSDGKLIIINVLANIYKLNLGLLLNDNL